jgi:hypothetical protein
VGREIDKQGRTQTKNGKTVTFKRKSAPSRRSVFFSRALKVEDNVCGNSFSNEVRQKIRRRVAATIAKHQLRGRRSEKL